MGCTSPVSSIQREANIVSEPSQAQSNRKRVWAKGKKNGRTVHYDQRKQVARASIDAVGSDWETATDSVLGAVERQAERRRLTNGRST